MEDAKLSFSAKTKRFIHKLDIDSKDLAAIGTWAIVFVITLYILQQSSADTKEKFGIIVTSYLLYIMCFFGATRTKKLSLAFITPIALRYVFLALQLACAFVIMLMIPMDFTPILTIIWAGMLIHFFSFRASILIIIAVVSVWFTIYGMHWDKNYVLFSGLLYGSFHIFAIVTTNQALKAELAKEKADAINLELLTTQQLLTQSTRQNERTRIARELHDLLGHHLTALTINLQVAGHLCGRANNTEAKEKVETSHALAKLLLSDVREAVSAIKENQYMDLDASISTLFTNLPSLTLHKSIDANIDMDHIELMHTLIRCVQEASTNTLKHTNATDFWLTLKNVHETQHEYISMTMRDNGQVSERLNLGNGLKGMNERVALLNGNMQTDTTSGCLKIDIKIPLVLNLINDNKDESNGN